MNQTINLSIIAPMYNESLRIRENIEKLMKKLRERDDSWELILINDGSTDGTLKIVQKINEREENIHLISYPRNRGRGHALRRGFDAARGEYIITTESDLSWGEDIVDKLYTALRETGADVVIASPYLKGGRLENIPLKRAFLSRFGNKLLTFAVSGNLTMISGMTRGYRREVIDSLSLESERKEIHLEIVSKCSALGFKIMEIPAVLRWEKEENGEPQRKSSFHSRKLILSHLAFSFYQKPMIIFGVSGFIMLLAGIILGIIFVVQRYMGTLNPTRPLYILMIILLLAGIQMLSFGFIANQIGIVKKEIYRIQQKFNRS